ncbi:hypothetical protein [Microbacterium amylolyticum]|uniref:CU044_5270 family protein n=1 Tax=Microbacterium amylolyticum TaxID=936337 RepID=A0ABS4ZEV4_9MICO|nr:hypothetical protein [Microbacterium amylolyticum]MBP2435815.1 hypothetical protein [Microbacterium amylolyticum]
MNDLLSSLLRAADPGTVKRGDPLSALGLRELAAYEAREAALARSSRSNSISSPRRQVWRPMPLAAGGAFLVLLFVVVFAATSVLRPAPAVAATPPLLELASVSQSAPELLKEMENMRRKGQPPGMTIRAQSWALNTSIGEDGMIESSVVEPQWSETTFLPDGSVRYRLVTADPFPGQNDDTLPEPGTVLVDEVFLPGDWDTPVDEAPPTGVGDVAAYLATLTGADTLTGGQAIREISTIVSNTLLTPEQEAALIGYLNTLGGIQVSGSTTDRLGRVGIVFSATDRDPEQFEDRLIISPSSGQILATETLYIGSDRTDIASPAVIDYTAWER